MSEKMLAKFDTHVHYLMKTPLDESLVSFKKVFDTTGVEKMAFMSIPQEKSEGTDHTQNLKALFFKDSFSPNGYAFAGLVHNENLSKKHSLHKWYAQRVLMELVEGNELTV